MSEYTPTTAAVRERYSMQDPVQHLLRDEFDRWLAAHDAAELEFAYAEIARLQETVAQVHAAWFGPCKFDLESDGRAITAILAKATVTAEEQKQ